MSAVGFKASAFTIFFHSFCSGRKVTQGDSTSTTRTRVPHCLLDDLGESVRVAGEAACDEIRTRGECITSGWNSRRPVPSGDSFESQSGSVVGEGWPWSCRTRGCP